MGIDKPLSMYLWQSLPCGVGQEEAHETAAGEQDGDYEGGSGTVAVQQCSYHHVADDASETSRDHRHGHSGSTGMKYEAC